MRLEIESNVASLPYFHANAVDHGSEPNPVSAEQSLKQGIAAAQNGERALARTLLLSVTEAEPRNLDAWLWLASISEYPEELLGFLSRVLEIDPANERACQWESATRSLLAKTFVQRGITANTDGQTDFAIQCFDRALGYDVRCESAWFWKSSLAESDQEREVYLARVLDINPDNQDAQRAMVAIVTGKAEAKLNAARRAAFAGDSLGSETIIDQILDREPDNVEAWCMRSQIAFTFEEKLEAYSRVLELDADHALARAGQEYLTKIRDLANASADPALIDPTAIVAETVDAAEQFATEPVSIDASGADLNEIYSPQPAFDQEPAHEPFALRYNPELGERYADENLHQYLTQESYSVPAPYPVESEDRFDEALHDASYENVNDEPQAAAHFEEEGSPDTPIVVDFSVHETFADNPVFAEPIAVDEINADLAAFDPFESKVDDKPVPKPAQPIETVPDVQSASADEIVPETDFAAVLDSARSSQHSSGQACPFCGSENESQVFSCSSCHAVLSLSDIETLFADSSHEKEAIEDAVTKMEAEWNQRDFSEHELTTLGLGHINLKNFDKGLAYLQEASSLDPNNVILAGQVNAIAIRIEDLRRQEEYHDSLPKGKTILVVDDSPTVRKLISSKLEKCGHNVLTAVDGIEAIEVIESVVPDLVLLDIAMPRMDGYSVCKLIRAKESVKNVPVVMISGKDGFFDKVRGRMAGTTGYITKPFGPETLMRALDTYLLPDEEAVS